MSKPAVLELATALDLESERKYASQSTKTARVKIERGHAWLIRILPFPQGPGKEVFARLAQHWIGGRSVMCKANTSPNFGGDPSYDCPICSTAAECKNEARDDDERDEFYEVEARIQYRCYCLVFRKEDDRGRLDEMQGDEIFIPYEFNLPKTSFAALAQKIERSKTRNGASPLGLLDLETGSDLWAIRDKKNSLTFDLDEGGPGPIFTLDDAFDDKIARVWKHLKQPTVKYMPDDRMAQLAEMVAEKAFEKAAKSLSERDDDRGRGRGGDDRRGGGSRGRFHEAEDEPRGRGRGGDAAGDQEETPRRAAAGGNRFARAQAAIGGDAGDGVAQDDDQIPGAEVPARRAAAPASRRPAVATAATEQPEAEEPPPVSSARGGAAARPAAGRVAVPAAVSAGRRAGGPVPPPAARSEGGRIEDDAPGEGEPPEEAQDPAPAEPVEKEAAPPTRSAPARSPLQGALRTSVAKLASSGR